PCAPSTRRYFLDYVPLLPGLLSFPTRRNNDVLQFLPALKTAIDVIDGFESPYGMELLATVDWLITKEGCEPTLGSIRAGLQRWPAGQKWAQRKQQMFDDRSLQMAVKQLK